MALPISVFPFLSYAPLFPVLLNPGLLTTLALCSNCYFTFLILALPACGLIFCHVSCPHPPSWFPLMWSFCPLSSDQGEHHCCRSSGLLWCTEMRTDPLVSGWCTPSASKYIQRCSSEAVLGRFKQFHKARFGRGGEFSQGHCKTDCLHLCLVLAPQLSCSAHSARLMSADNTLFCLVSFTEMSELFRRCFPQCA